MKDYYKILEVDKNASHDEIASAYRKKARMYHPDVNKEPNAAEKFKEVAEAFEVLGDADKKARYDNPVTHQQPFVFNNSPFDIFNSIFGGGGFGGFGHRTPQRGIDAEQKLDVSFEEAALGCSKDIKITIAEKCNDCQGTGVNTWLTCNACQGTGRKMVRQDPFMVQTTCSSCRGTGRIPDKKCQQCKDGVSEYRDEIITINIPPGAFSGLKMKVAGKGEVDENGYRGNLYLVLIVAEHPLFLRNDCDILCEVAVPFSTLVLGGEITVPTLRGEAKVKIKAGTQDGKRIRLSKMGVQQLNRPENIGNMYVLLKVAIPTKISKEYKKLIEKLTQYEKEHE